MSRVRSVLSESTTITSSQQERLEIAAAIRSSSLRVMMVALMNGIITYAITDRMRNLKLTLAYDGTSFHGWQIQPNLATIQGTLQQALEKLFNHEVSVTGAGRTDAGVHAHGQVATVQTIRTMDTGAVVRGANALLPQEVRVLQAEDVD